MYRMIFAPCVLLIALCLVADAASPRPGPFIKTPAGDLAIFPPDNPWNQDISKLPVLPQSATYIQSIGPDKPIHPDFGTMWKGRPMGIAFILVDARQPRVPVTFEYADESDPGPYPIPDNAPIEGGPDSDGDRHIIVIDYTHKKLYETWKSYKTDRGWKAGSGAVFDLTSNKSRPQHWTSADAAGLPIFPGLARYDEVERGEIRHALRFTVQRTQRAYIAPATHWASRSSDPNLPPMGLRLRLRADYDISHFPPQARVICKALKTYGLILADNGGDWFISGAPDPKWDDEQLNTLKRLRGRDFECVNTGPLVTR